MATTNTSDIYFEDWGATYGSAYLIDDEWSVGDAELTEDGPIARTPPAGAAADIAFVDGVRRGEGLLYGHSDNGGLVRGVAGAHACGAALCPAGGAATFAQIRTRRLVIFGGGISQQLRAVGAYSWHASSVDSTDPDAPLDELQTRMREAEGRLAEEISEAGWLAIADGPLNFVRSRDLPVVGYVKTHHRALLTPELHAQVPTLDCGQRTPLFALGRDRYSCYARIDPGNDGTGPWHGIVRLEVSQSFGLDRAVQLADTVSRALPRFAGVAHRDPRAPQNLQPIGALERTLRRRLGSSRMAARAVRSAVLHSRTGTP